MEVMKKDKSTTTIVEQSSSTDPFILRIEAQSTIIKKMLDEIELPPQSLIELKPENKMNFLSFEFDESEDRR